MEALCQSSDSVGDHHYIPHPRGTISKSCNFPQPTHSGISDDVQAVLVELPYSEVSNPPLQPQAIVVVNDS